jgi:hypothetical protein
MSVDCLRSAVFEVDNRNQIAWVCEIYLLFYNKRELQASTLSEQTLLPVD